jgi:hypothetical protein
MQTLTHPFTGRQAPNNLTTAFRYCDDISMAQAIRVARNLGGDPYRVLCAGYGTSTPAFVRLLSLGSSIKRKSVIIPCRDRNGRIVALHNESQEWFSSPSPHIANPARAPFAQVRICSTTPEADSVSLNENVAAIAINGCGEDEVRAVLSALVNSRVLARAA